MSSTKHLPALNSTPAQLRIDSILLFCTLQRQETPQTVLNVPRRGLCIVTRRSRCAGAKCVLNVAYTRKKSARRLAYISRENHICIRGILRHIQSCGGVVLRLVTDASTRTRKLPQREWLSPDDNYQWSRRKDSATVALTSTAHTTSSTNTLTKIEGFPNQASLGRFNKNWSGKFPDSTRKP
jgi:hypothetical protein